MKFLLLMLMSASVFAGREGGGGNAGVCFNSKKVVREIKEVYDRQIPNGFIKENLVSVKILDLYEAEQDYVINGSRVKHDLFLPEASEKPFDYLKRFIERFEESLPGLSDNLNIGLKKMQQSEVISYRDGGLEKVKDVEAEHYLDPDYCVIATIIKWEALNPERGWGNFHFSIDGRLFYHDSHSDESQKIAYLHELLYLKADSAKSVRRILARLLRTNIQRDFVVKTIRDNKYPRGLRNYDNFYRENKILADIINSSRYKYDKLLREYKVDCLFFSKRYWASWYSSSDFKLYENYNCYDHIRFDKRKEIIREHATIGEDAFLNYQGRLKDNEKLREDLNYRIENLDKEKKDVQKTIRVLENAISKGRKKRENRAKLYQWIEEREQISEAIKEANQSITLINTREREFKEKYKESKELVEEAFQPMISRLNDAQLEVRRFGVELLKNEIHKHSWIDQETIGAMNRIQEMDFKFIENRKSDQLGVPYQGGTIRPETLFKYSSFRTLGEYHLTEDVKIP